MTIKSERIGAKTEELIQEILKMVSKQQVKRLINTFLNTPKQYLEPLLIMFQR